MADFLLFKEKEFILGAVTRHIAYPKVRNMDVSDKSERAASAKKVLLGKRIASILRKDIPHN